MKSRHFLSNVIKGSCVFFLFIAVVSHEALCKDKELDSKKYMEAVRKFSDSVIKNGRDSYGRTHTPLFVDGLQVETLEPVIWKFNPSLVREWIWARQREGWSKQKIRAEQDKVPTQTWVLCNFASQQPLLRTLDGLTALTGQKKYRQAAEDAARYALKHLRTPNGLLYWGGHTAWDLQHERPVGPYNHHIHELKGQQPYYSLMWRVDAPATRKLMETVWGSHVRNWSLLDYGRHASNGIGRKTDKNPRRLPQWDHEFIQDVEVPYPSASEVPFVHVTMPLMHSGVMLTVLDKNADALTWTRRLVYRWQQARHPKTGLSGGLLARLKDGASAGKALRHVHPKIGDSNIVGAYYIKRYHQLSLAQLQAGENLIAAGGKSAEIGNEFVKWASEDLKAYAKHSYDPRTGMFIAVMTDGTPIKWQECRYGYFAPENMMPRKPDGFILWAYAMAYRLTRDEAHWRMARELCISLRLGEIGRFAEFANDNNRRQLRFDTDQDDWLAIYALLELYRATKDKAILRFACHISDNIIETQTETGLFPHYPRQYARTGAEEPLAIMHLAAAIDGKDSLLPRPMFDRRAFHSPYHGELKPHQRKRRDTRTYDHLVFYGKLRSP